MSYPEYKVAPADPAPPCAPSSRATPALGLGKIVSPLASLVLGFAVAIVLHFLIYRFSLPIKPFVYVAF